MHEWLKRVEVMKTENPDLWQAEIKFSFALVDVAGNAAVAKLNVHKRDLHFPPIICCCTGSTMAGGWNPGYFWYRG